MCHGAAAAGDAVHVRVGEEVGMCQNRLARQKPKAVERLGIGLAVALQRVAMGPVTLGGMSLHMAATLGCQRTQSAQRRIGAGGDEARRDDRQDAPVAGSRPRT